MEIFSQTSHNPITNLMIKWKYDKIARELKSESLKNIKKY